MIAFGRVSSPGKVVPNGKTWKQSNITSVDFHSIYNANGIWVTGSYSKKGLYYSESYIPS